MSTLPFSAPTPRSLPTITSGQPIEQLLTTWWAHLNPLVQNARPQPTPLNFSVTNARGGLNLSWSPVTGGDGYEILKSISGSFTDDLQVVPVKNRNQAQFFDSTGGNALTVHYRLRTTSGTITNPQSQRGPESGVIRHTSIDASDTTSVPVTVRDNFTTDKTRALSRLGNYGAIKLSTLGKAGGTNVAVGSNSLKGNPAGTPATGTSSFASLGTSENTSAKLIVGGGASIVPDPTNPGIIDSTELQGTPVTETSPTDQQLLQYSATDSQWDVTSTIDCGSY